MPVGMTDGEGRVVYGNNQQIQQIQAKQASRKAEIDRMRAEARRMAAEGARTGWMAQSAEHALQFMNGFFSTFTPSYSLTLNTFRIMGFISQSTFDDLTRTNIYNTGGAALGTVLAVWLPFKAKPSQFHYLWRVDTFKLAKVPVKGATPIIQVMIPGMVKVFEQGTAFAYIQGIMTAMGNLMPGIPSLRPR